MFISEIWMNRKPGGNGAVSDQPTDGEQVATMVRKLQGSDGGWIQLCGPDKFMTLTSRGDAFSVVVTTAAKPPTRWGLAKVDVNAAIDAAKAFMESGELHKQLTWSAA
jgi:hypothetical protein